MGVLFDAFATTLVKAGAKSEKIKRTPTWQRAALGAGGLIGAGVGGGVGGYKLTKPVAEAIYNHPNSLKSIPHAILHGAASGLVEGAGTYGGVTLAVMGLAKLLEVAHNEGRLKGRREGKAKK